MKTYCVGCKNGTINSNSQLIKTKTNRLSTEFNCIICSHKNLDLLRLALTEKWLIIFFGKENIGSSLV